MLTLQPLPPVRIHGSFSLGVVRSEPWVWQGPQSVVEGDHKLLHRLVLDVATTIYVANKGFEVTDEQLPVSHELGPFVIQLKETLEANEPNN